MTEWYLQFLLDRKQAIQDAWVSAQGFDDHSSNCHNAGLCQELRYLSEIDHEEIAEFYRKEE